MPKCKYFFLKPNDIFCLFCTISTRPQRIKYCYVHLTVLSSPFHFDSTICVSAKIKNYSTMPQFVYLSLLCGLNVWFVEFGARTEPNRTEKQPNTNTRHGQSINKKYHQLNIKRVNSCSCCPCTL